MVPYECWGDSESVLGGEGRNQAAIRTPEEISEAITQHLSNLYYLYLHL